MHDIIKEIKASLNKESDLGSFPYFPDKRYKPVTIDEKNFREIKKDSPSKKCIAFIDGGNQEIISAPNLSLQVIRVYYTIYKDNKRIKNKKEEFFALIIAEQKEGGQQYKVKTFPLDRFSISDFDIDSFDKTLSEGGNRINISRVGDVVRAYAEISIGSQIISELSEGDIIVRDGTLQSQVTGEEAYFSEFYRQALEKNIIIAGLAKTNTLFTDKAKPLGAVLDNISKLKGWCYNPIAEFNIDDHQADMYMVKLHERSDYIFRFEVFNKLSYDIDSVLSIIYQNSRDPVFLGYPYGLIEADRFARVSNQEKEYLLMKFISTAGSDWKTIQSFTRSKDAHSVLDNIS